MGTALRKFTRQPRNPTLATTLLLIRAVSPGLRLTHHDASGHVPAGEEGERSGVLRAACPGHRRSRGSGPGARGGSRAADAATARVSRGWSPDTADRSPPATPAPRGGADSTS